MSSGIFQAMWTVVSSTVLLETHEARHVIQICKSEALLLPALSNCNKKYVESANGPGFLPVMHSCSNTDFYFVEMENKSTE